MTTLSEFDQITERDRAVHTASLAMPAQTFLSNLVAIAWQSRAMDVSPALVDAYGAESGAMLRRIAMADGPAVDLLTTLACLAGTWHKLGADIRAMLERDRSYDAPLDAASVGSTVGVGRSVRSARHAYVVGSGSRDVHGKPVSWRTGATHDMLPAVPAGDYVAALAAREMVPAHGTDAIAVAALTRHAYHGDVPKLLGGEHLAFPQVIHAGRSDDPYGVAWHNRGLRAALDSVDPDYRDVVAEACGTYGPENAPSVARLRWPDVTASPKLKPRATERGHGARVFPNGDVPHTVRTVRLPTYRRDADGSVYVVVGHGSWRLRPSERRTIKRKRTAITATPATLALRSAEAAETLERGASVRIAAGAVKVSVARAQSGRYTVTVRTGDDVRKCQVRRPGLVMRAVAARV